MEPKGSQVKRSASALYSNLFWAATSFGIEWQLFKADNKERHMAKTNYDITRDQVLRHLSYIPESGELRYLTDGHKRRAGDLIPASANVINILGSSYSKLKLIWLMIHGEWPTGKINTKDLGSGDCSFASLLQGGDAIGQELTQARLREVLEYSPESGAFIWKLSMSSTGLKGSEAGVIASNGYVKIRVDGRLYLAHRMACLYMTGDWPADLIDHIDGKRSNNAWSNLRNANKSENAQNLRKAQSNNKSTGMLGVYRSGKGDRWGAQITINGVNHRPSFHDTPEAAHQAYLKLKMELHPFGMLTSSAPAVVL